MAERRGTDKDGKCMNMLAVLIAEYLAKDATNEEICEMIQFFSIISTSLRTYMC